MFHCFIIKSVLVLVSLKELSNNVNTHTNNKLHLIEVKMCEFIADYDNICFRFVANED